MCKKDAYFSGQPGGHLPDQPNACYGLLIQRPKQNHRARRARVDHSTALKGPQGPYAQAIGRGTGDMTVSTGQRPARSLLIKLWAQAPQGPC